MSQLNRVIAVMSDGKERTLRQIEAAIWERTGHGDTQAAISARLREVHCKGWEKQTRHETVNGKQVWWYRLVPFNAKEQEAAA